MQRDDMPYRLLEERLESLHIDRTVARETISLFDIRPYRKGGYFSSEGEQTDRLGFVLDGVFSMFTIQDDGRVFVKDFPTKAQFLLASFEPGRPAKVSIQSLVDSTVLEARYSAVGSLLRGYPELERAARRGAERRMEELYRRLELFATLETRERYRSFKQDFGDLEALIPQYLIASYLGVTPTQLSRIRNRERLDICK
jgi:CRP-like cAMP-binding protein